MAISASSRSLAGGTPTRCTSSRIKRNGLVQRWSARPRDGASSVAELVRTGTTGDETIAVEIGHRVQCRHEVGQEDTGVAVPILEIDPRRRAFVPTQENGCVRRLAVSGRCRDHSDTHGRRGEPAENVGARHHPHRWIGWGERRALRGPRGLLAHEPETRCRHCGRLTWVLRIGSSTPALSARRRRTCVSCTIALVAAPRDGDCPNPREDSAMTAAPPALAGLPSRPAHRMIPVSRAAPHRVLPDGWTQSLRFVTLRP